MPQRKKDAMEIREVLRRVRAGESDRTIAQTLEIDRKTVRRYREWAAEQGLLEGDLPPLADLQTSLNVTLPAALPPQNVSTVEPYRDIVTRLRKNKVEVAAIHQRLRERGYSGSYASVYRFVQQLEPREPEVTVRVETRPGEEAQVDFGYAGRMRDPDTDNERKTWAFVMTLSWSRHQYVEFVYDQKIATWLSCHRNAFRFFEGVPERVVIDNLKAGIAKRCWEEPEAQRAYGECAEHYGFLIHPCRPYTPEHKGKVEKGGVHYVKRNFLGGREPTTLAQANRDVRTWCLGMAGKRIHGTTREQPLTRFTTEQAALRPLPGSPYDLATWKQVHVHRDCHIVFDNAYYSAPFRLVGQALWVRGGIHTVQLYTADYQLVATHNRATQPGQRLTQLAHLPTTKVAGLMLTRETCREQAADVGPAATTVVERLLEHRPEDRLRTAGRVLALRERFGTARLEAACERAVRYEDTSYITIKRILEQELDQEPMPETAPAPAAHTFARTALELVSHLLGANRWNSTTN
jgi:transposase